MKPTRLGKALLVVCATLGTCFPQALLAAQPLPASNVTDVSLRDGGVLLGQVVDGTGKPQANAAVSLQSGQQKLGASKTDAGGYFAFSGLRGGVYQVAAANGQGSYRVWAAGSAPPTAQPGALVVAGQTPNPLAGQQPDVVRAQGRLGFWLSNPWVVAGLVATAVAVPVAIVAADRHHDQPVSP